MLVRKLSVKKHLRARVRTCPKCRSASTGCWVSCRGKPICLRPNNFLAASTEPDADGLHAVTYRVDGVVTDGRMTAAELDRLIADLRRNHNVNSLASPAQEREYAPLVSDVLRKAVGQ